MKSHYISIITSELNKLADDQLYKVLVLVKNTIDANEIPVHVQNKNKSLFPVELLTKGEAVSDALMNETNKVRELLEEKNLTEGYGIISMPGYWSGSSAKHIVMYVCFCIPNVIDGMIEVRRTYEDGKFGGFGYIVTTGFGDETRKVDVFYRREYLEAALDSIVEIYTTKT